MSEIHNMICKKEEIASLDAGPRCWLAGLGFARAPLMPDFRNINLSAAGSTNSFGSRNNG